MLQMLTWKKIAAGVVFVSLASAVVIAQQQGPARGNHEWAPPVPQGKHHNLAATLETVQWGWLDPREKPKLVVESGDTVSIETMMHSHDKVQPGMTIEQAVDLRKANPGGGPHSMTGPIFVNGAEPGDVLEIRILRIEPKAWAVNFNLPARISPRSARSRPRCPKAISSSSQSTWRSAPSSSSQASCWIYSPSRARLRSESTRRIRLRGKAA